MNSNLPARRPGVAPSAAFASPFDAAGLSDFLKLALVDPATAAGRLASWLDDKSPEVGSSLSDDAAALDDVADGDFDAADWLAVLARDRRRYPMDVRLGLAAVVAGVRARLDDTRSP